MNLDSENDSSRLIESKFACVSSVKCQLLKNHICIKINNQHATAMVESGADVCCIKQTAINEFQLTQYAVRPTDQITHIRTAANELTEVVGVVNIPVSIGHEKLT